MDLYGQEPEARLLGAFLSRLEERSVIDVGAEHGSLVEEMLRSGAEAVHAIEPEPGNANFIRERFGGVAHVSVHEYAVSDLDGELELYRSVDPSGAPLSFGHTLLERTDTDEIAWREPIRVAGRSLASLVEAGELPARAGILKVDTEGSDFAVIAGMGHLECDVVMVEHWVDLPHSFGPCPWSTEVMASALHERGFSHYACIEHRGEFVFLKWDDGSMPIGHMGNLVFLHDRVLERLFPDLLECASQLADGAVELGEMYAAAASERLVVIEELERAREALAATAEERLALIEELQRECDLRSRTIELLSQRLRE
jgi:FkbM family methyltransferase